MGLGFEWHLAKAARNLLIHGINVELATTVFKDAFAIELVDERTDYDEPRFITIGMAEGGVMLFVVHTERENRIRIISARRATRDEQDEYFEQNA
jgi:uncharacterized protein